MAVGSQQKVNQLAKDLSLKPKDLTDILAAAGIEAKTQKALEVFELDVIWEGLTKSHQITGIEDYIDGVTGIPSLRKKAAEAKPEVKPAKSAPAEKPEAKPAEKEEKKPEAKPAYKPAEKPAEKQNVARSAGERFESRMSAANEKSKQEKTEKKNTDSKSQKHEKKPKKLSKIFS